MSLAKAKRLGTLASLFAVAAAATAWGLVLTACGKPNAHTPPGNVDADEVAEAADAASLEPAAEASGPEVQVVVPKTKPADAGTIGKHDVGLHYLPAE